MAKDLNYTLSLKDLFSKKMQGAVDATNKMDSSMSGIGSKLAAIGASIGLTALGKSMVTTGAKFDSYKLQLETLLGSQQKASDAFNAIKEDAAKTPFDVASLTQANTMLISAGVGANDARKTIMDLGNAIASTGGGSDELSRMSVNLQQIKTLGKASAMDIKQFAFAGIPIYQMLAKTTGKSVEQLRTMDITYEQLSNSFAKAREKGGMFFGGLEKQSASVGGQLSNLGDQFTNTLVSFYDRLKPAISSIINLISKLLSWVDKNKETIIMFGKMVMLIGSIALGYALWTTKSVILTAATVAYNTVLELQLAYTMAAAEGMGFLEAAQWALNVAMSANPIGIVVAALAALVVAIGAVIANYQRLKEEYQTDIQKAQEKAIKSEISSVETLADRYLKLGLAKNKQNALDKAIAFEKNAIAKDQNDWLKKSYDETDPEKKLAAKRKLTELGSSLNALDNKSNFEEYLAGGKKNANGLIGGGGGGGGGGALGTGVNISAARPQSLVININELVHELKVQAGNLTESTMKIKEEVSKIFLEMVNDANLAIR